MATHVQVKVSAVLAVLGADLDSPACVKQPMRLQVPLDGDIGSCTHRPAFELANLVDLVAWRGRTALRQAPAWKELLRREAISADWCVARVKIEGEDQPVAQLFTHTRQSPERRNKQLLV